MQQWWNGKLRHCITGTSALAYGRTLARKYTPHCDGAHEQQTISLSTVHDCPSLPSSSLQSTSSSSAAYSIRSTNTDSIPVRIPGQRSFSNRPGLQSSFLGTGAYSIQHSIVTAFPVTSDRYYTIKSVPSSPALENVEAIISVPPGANLNHGIAESSVVDQPQRQVQHDDLEANMTAGHNVDLLQMCVEQGRPVSFVEGTPGEATERAAMTILESLQAGVTSSDSRSSASLANQEVLDPDELHGTPLGDLQTLVKERQASLPLEMQMGSVPAPVRFHQCSCFYRHAG